MADRPCRAPPDLLPEAERVVLDLHEQFTDGADRHVQRRRLGFLNIGEEMPGPGRQMLFEERPLPLEAGRLGLLITSVP